MKTLGINNIMREINRSLFLYVSLFYRSPMHSNICMTRKCVQYALTASAMPGLPGLICQSMWVINWISPVTVHSYAVIGLEPRQLQDLNLKLAFNV